MDRVDVVEAHETELQRQLAATKSTPSTDVQSVHLWAWIACPPSSQLLQSLLLTALAIPRVTL